MDALRNKGKKDGKVRILHVAQAAGGVRRYLQTLIKYLDQEQFENILICSFDYDKNQFERLGAVVEQLEMHREIGVHDFGAAVALRKLIRDYQPDVVYAHSSKAGALARLAKLGLPGKCIYNPHGWAFNMRGSKWKQKIYCVLERIMAPFCDEIICISDYEKESALRQKICGEGKLNVILNGIDLEACEKQEHKALSRAELGIPQDAFVVGMVGRLSPQKAPDVFIQAAGMIKASVPNAFFLMVGDGEQRGEVTEYAKNGGFGDSLRITGWVDDPMPYIRLFDVALLLSRWEGFGLVLPEYMLAEKPIVATHVDAIPEVVQNGNCAMLVEADCPDEAAEHVIFLQEHTEVANRLVKQGKDRVVHYFDMKRVSQEHERLFRNYTI